MSERYLGIVCCVDCTGPSGCPRFFLSLSSCRSLASPLVTISKFDWPMFSSDCEISIQALSLLRVLSQQGLRTQVPPKFVDPLDLYTPNCCPDLLFPKVGLLVISGD